MSKFKPSAHALAVSPPSRPMAAAAVLPYPTNFPTPAPALTMPPVRSIPAAQSSIASRITFFLLCTYQLAAPANDISQHLIGSGTYLSAISVTLLPFAAMASGLVLRNMQLGVGRWWSLFLVWMMLCIPFSSWVSGSMDTFSNFATRNFPLLAYTVASVLAVSQLRRMIDVMVIRGALVILSCALYGADTDGRFSIPDSIFFDNPNGLAFELLMGMGVFVYWIFRQEWWRKIGGAALFLAACVYEFKTGSRGNFLALVLTGVLGVILFRKRINFAALAVVLLGLAAVTPFVVSSQQIDRLTHMSWGGVQANAATEDADLQSQAQRTEILKRGIGFTLTHPIFGIGPGQFEDYMWKEAKERGVHVASLNAHNTYIQISSEMGFPGFIFYLLTTFAAFRLTTRAYRLATLHPEGRELSNIAICVLLMLIAYSISAAFLHMGYSGYLPLLGGWAFVLWSCASQAQAPAAPQQVAQPTRSGPPFRPSISR